MDERHSADKRVLYGPARLIVVALLVAATDILSAWLLRFELGTGARIAIALLPVPVNAGFVALMVAAIRKLDEFQKRIHFEAVALAFLATALTVLMYGYLQKARMVGPLNVGLVWALMSLFYAIGYGVAARHYR